MRDLADAPPGAPPRSLREIGLAGYAPYLMNRIMGRYNASLRAEMAALGLSTPKMRALAVLSVVDRPLIRELAGLRRGRAVHAEPRPRRAGAHEGLVRREATHGQPRHARRR
jgi:hypothetical protein